MTRKKPVSIADAYPDFGARAEGTSTATRMTSVGLPEYMHARLGYLRAASNKSLKALILEALEQTYPGDPQDPSLPLHRGTPAPAAPADAASDAEPSPAFEDVPLH
ncbi:hypothetical protein NJC10_11120 [Micrococcus sp. M4NT]|uniref:hypothetical protein n=1 Tax=Micrococcus sp. M4NT TaxID=2957501 RepID=UPI0029B5C90D|nr:hypothetical protein [Micrococcus sp. M4NT]MDX2342192.1 hypothetical protein [Micrococcus sp. M4NT]